MSSSILTSPCGLVGTLFTVQKALPLFNVFVDFTNRFVWYRCRSLNGSCTNSD
jgi:hypothetical protein